MKKIYLLIILFSLGCATGTKYIDPAKAKGSKEWGPKEIQLTAIRMVSSLYKHLQDTKDNVFIDISKIRNRTSEHIDTKMLANEMVTQLIRRKIKFIDRNLRTEALKEIEAGQTGLIDSNSAIEAGNLKSPNFLLSGEITDNLRYVDGKRIQYIIVTFRLTRTATTQIEWQDKKEFLKSTKEERYTW